MVEKRFAVFAAILFVGFVAMWISGIALRSSAEEELFVLRPKNLAPPSTSSSRTEQEQPGHSVRATGIDEKSLESESSNMENKLVNKQHEKDGKKKKKKKKDSKRKPKKVMEKNIDVQDDIGTSSLAVLVMSKSASQRVAVRESIALEEPSLQITVKFVTGNAREEGEEDLIISETDSPAEMLKTAFRWVVDNAPKVKYVAVVQESGVFWAERLLSLARTVPIDDYFVIGNIVHMKPRNLIIDPVWIPDEYPAYPLDDAGFLVTRPVCEIVAKYHERLASFPSQGISLGVWMAGLKVKWMHDDKTFRNDALCAMECLSVSGPFKTTAEMMNCKRQGLSTPLEKVQQTSFVRALARKVTSSFSTPVSVQRLNEDVGDPRLIIPPRTIIGKETGPDARRKVDLVILILSARSYKERREDMRRMLASQEKLSRSILIRFVVGLGQDALEEDTDDIIVMPVNDDYSVLPAKLKYGYGWVAVNHPEAKFVLKCDDDQAIWPNRVLKFLEDYSSDEMLLLGGVRLKIKAHRQGKWQEHQRWEPARYPPITLGSYGHIVSRPVYHYVAENEHVLYEFQGEDSSLAIWLSAFQAKVININDVMRNNLDCEGSPIVVGHNIVGRNKLLRCLNASIHTPLKEYHRWKSLERW